MSEGTPTGGRVEKPTAEAPHGRAGESAATRGGPLSGGLGLVVFFVLIAAAGFLTYRAFYTAPYPEPEPMAVVYMCSETNKPFEHVVEQGEKIPVQSPYSKKKTGYPVELCYCWDAEGKPTRSDPVYIIHNKWLGKDGDPVCPECSKPVWEHNTDYHSGKPSTEPAGTQSSLEE